MKSGTQRKGASPKLVREVTATYQTARPTATTRKLAPAELEQLAEQLVAAQDRGDSIECERLKKLLTTGFYREIRA